jgi:molybdopterin-binding protein
MPAKLSARNRLKGKVTSIKKGGVVGGIQIRLDGSGDTITSVITLDAVDDLDLKVGDSVYAIIKATEVMISKE